MIPIGLLAIAFHMWGQKITNWLKKNVRLINMGYIIDVDGRHIPIHNHRQKKVGYKDKF